MNQRSPAHGDESGVVSARRTEMTIGQAIRGRPPGRRLVRLRRLGVLRMLGPVALASGFLAAGMVPASASPATYSISMKAADKLGPYYGYTLVFYKATDGYATAKISGTVTGATSGDVAELWAKPFGATSFTSTGMQVTLTPDSTTSATYSFKVRPSLATAYQIQVLTGATVDVTSRNRTVYVATGGFGKDFRTHCSGDRCTTEWKFFELVPASAYRTESVKRMYFYKAVAAHRPRYLYLTKHASASRPRKINAGEFEQTIVFHYVSHWPRPARHLWAQGCAKDTEKIDGMGLPRPTGCGARRIFTYVYVG